VLVAIPFRARGKSRLPAEIRTEVALAMLGDVVEAAAAVGDVRVVTDDAAARLVAAELGAEVVDDPGGGQGGAVSAGLAGAEGICLVVNADLPRARPSDLNALAVPPRLGRVAIVEAADGTTNALGLPLAEVFQPLYGTDSAGQFRAHAVALDLPFEDLALPNLVDDVDTLADLERVGTRSGTRTRAILEAIAR
jgi:2-phospho-L-lactate/phosphoenolpyruvate guanylyltransferase